MTSDTDDGPRRPEGEAPGDEATEAARDALPSAQDEDEEGAASGTTRDAGDDPFAAQPRE